PAPASIQGDLRTAAVADPARARHRGRGEAGADGARHPRERFAGTPVKFFRLSIVVAAVAVVAAPGHLPAARAQGQTKPAQVPFPAGIDVVSLNVTVTDGTAKYVTDLAQGEFNVFEDGVKQEVTFFTRTNLPIALALLLDTSASMDTKLATAQEAAIGFARKLRPQDLAEIIDFDSRVVVLQPFTNSATELEQAIRQTSAGGAHFPDHAAL